MIPGFSDILLQWYDHHRRELPWRNTGDPYKVWLSEVILQQTQVSQGLPYYNRFIEAFPAVHDLAGAPQEKVLKLWQGLGYYSRARNLHQAAKVVVEEYNGVMPCTYKELKKLKGVGDYTASAVASICFNEPVAVLDGNVFRVLSRFWGIDVPINTTEGRKVFKEKAEQCRNHSDPGKYNQAIMEFGAIQCKPKKPLCQTCPLHGECVAYQQGKTQQLPVKLKKTKRRERNFNYMVFVNPRNETVLQRRAGKGIWENLYEFPLIETGKEVGKTALLNSEEFRSWKVKFTEAASFNGRPIKHLLSHQKLMIKFWRVEVPELPECLLTAESRKPVNWDRVGDFPVPAVIDKFLNKIDHKE